MPGKYPFLSVSIITICLYSVTFLLYKFNVIKKILHRQIWNVILLFSFLIVALIGLLAIIKINYRLNIPIYDLLLLYHVETGIVMAFTGIIHLTWHWSYYLKLLSGGPKETEKDKGTDFIYPAADNTDFKVLLIFLGITTTVSQIIFIREFLTVFNGNELVIGIIFAVWMFIIGLGSYSARLSNLNKVIKHLPVLIYILTIFPLLSIIILYNSRGLFFIRGELVSITGVFVFTFLILLIPCFIAGFVFSVSSVIFSQKKNKLGIAYSLDSMGSLAGGVVINLILLLYVNSMQVLSVLFFTGCVVIYYIFNKHKFRLFYLLSSVIVLIFSFFPYTNKYIKNQLFKPYQVIETQSVPSGNIDVAVYDNQVNLFHNNVLLYHSQNQMEVEEDVHYSMLLHKHPEKVLIISGGYIGLINEINKYKSVKEIDFIEPDRWTSKWIDSQFDTLPALNLNRVYSGPINYLTRCNKKYDIILLQCPMPYNLYYNRFYTVEFFQVLSKVSNNSTILSVKLEAGVNYLSDNEKEVLGLIYNSINQNFKNITVIPGNNYYFLAGKKPVLINYASVLKNKNFENEYVNEYYINDNLLQQRSNLISDDLRLVKGINKDLVPKAFLYQIKKFMEYNNLNYKVLSCVLLIITLIIYLRIKKIRKNLFITGFVAMSIEIALIFLIQIYAGNTFYITGIVITVLMSSIALGAWFGSKKSFRSVSFSVELGMITLLLVCITIPLLLQNIESAYINGAIFYPVYFLILVITGIVTGAIYSWSALIKSNDIKKTVADNYSADLMGSAFGSFATAIIFIPVLGIIGSGFFLAGIICISILINRLF